jgi:uncharacterized protein YbaR (Trm112 family)
MNSASTNRPASAVDPKLLEILVCPLTKGPLEYDAEKQELISRSAKLAYPIRDGNLIMLPRKHVNSSSANYRQFDLNHLHQTIH